METLRDIGIGLFSLALFAIIATGTYRYLDAKGILNFSAPKATSIALTGPVEIKTSRPIAVQNKNAPAAQPVQTQASSEKNWAFIGKGANGDDAVAGPFVLTQCSGKIDITKIAPGKGANVEKGMLKKDWQITGELFLPRGTYALLKGNLCSGFRP